MTDADILDIIKSIRGMCDQLAGVIGRHSTEHGDDPHMATACTEAIHRLNLGFVHIAYTSTHAARHVAGDLSEAVQSLLQDWSDMKDERGEDDN